MDGSHEDHLVELAEEALRRAHAPYSRLSVGASVRCASGATYSGCNVESAAFPVGGCAEHHAIAAAVRSEGSGVRLLEVVVLARDGEGRPSPVPPCGACRQLIHEFGPGARVRYLGRDGALVERSIGELLPDSFSFEP